MKNSQATGKTASTIYYHEMAQEWLEYSEFRLKESSYQKYRGIMNKYLLPAFGVYQISQLTTSCVGEFLKHLRVTDLNRKGGRLSPQYINSILTVFRETSYYSAARGCPFPCDFHYLSQKVEKRECAVFSHEESTRLVSYLLKDMDRSKMGILLCFYTGMRLGELCALNGKISVWKTNC